ncbi:outer membrane beta-barrel protein [Wenyingzhuangia sp. IMCC45467]
MKKFITLLLLAVSSIAYTQSISFEISGILKSKNEKTPIESATVYLQRVKDSTIISYTITNQKGEFALENKTTDKKAHLFISYIGYKTYKKQINISTKKQNFNTILLEENANILNEVVIRAQAPPITVKKDTLEFNVKSFKTKKDANVEDLLKKLPGVEVDDDGKIKINGKEVNKILVNGKPFFSNDVTIATKNLTKDIIEKIQVSDTKSDEEGFTGEEGSKTNKTINLVIKKENNKGNFGRLAAGSGTDERYEYAGMYNYFNNDLRVSVLAGGNNINSPGFSYGEINKMFGGSSSRTINRQINNWGSNGIITSNNYGLNYVDTYSKKLDVSTNYFGSDTETINLNKSKTENLTPNNTFFTNASTNSNRQATNHSSDTKLTIKPDSTLLITITPKFRQTKTTNAYESNASSLDINNDSINKSYSNNLSKTTNNNFTNNLSATKRIGNKGSYLKFNWYYQTVKNISLDRIQNQLIKFNNPSENSDINQLRNGDNNTKTLILEPKYQWAIIKKKLSLNMGVTYRKVTQKNIRNSYDFDENNNRFKTDINTDFSSDFVYDNISTSPTAQLEYRGKKWSSSIKTEYLFRTLNNSDNLRPHLSLKRRFNATQINYRLNYHNPKTNFGLYYNLNNNAPNINQIQPFVNITNPTNTIIGNPNLVPTKRHTLNANFSKNNFQKGINFYSYIYATYTKDQIISKSTINSDLTRETTYANVDGTSSIYMYADYNKRIKLDTLKSIKIGLGFNTNFSKNINYVNNLQYTSFYNNLGPSIWTEFNWDKIANINIRYNPYYTKNSFDTHNQNINNLVAQEFTNHRIRISTTNYFLKKLELRNEINYTYNPNISDGFDKSSWFWNATIAYSLFKDSATLSLKAYDVLNQNINVYKYSYQNVVVDRQSTVLQQYFMLSFSWKFNSLKKKKK